MKLIEVNKTPEGSEILIAGVQVRTWDGPLHRHAAEVLRDKLIEAIGHTTKPARANFDDDPSSDDAWKRMDFVCESCQALERIWNARQHVTPFGVVCPSCGGHMRHRYPDSDTYEPDRRPQVDELIFIDLPPELALIYAHRQVALRVAAGYEMLCEEENRELAKKIAIENMAQFGGHQPALMRLLS